MQMPVSIYWMIAQWMDRIQVYQPLISLCITEWPEHRSTCICFWDVLKCCVIPPPKQTWSACGRDGSFYDPESSGYSSLGLVLRCRSSAHANGSCLYQRFASQSSSQMVRYAKCRTICRCDRETRLRSQKPVALTTFLSSQASTAAL